MHQLIVCKLNIILLELLFYMTIEMAKNNTNIWHENIRDLKGLASKYTHVWRADITAAIFSTHHKIILPIPSPAATQASKG